MCHVFRHLKNDRHNHSLYEEGFGLLRAVCISLPKICRQKSEKSFTKSPRDCSFLEVTTLRSFAIL